MAKPNQDQNQGEGNREADRNYRRGATEFADTEKEHRAAREAGREVEEADRAQESEGDDPLDENDDEDEPVHNDEDR